MRGYPIVRQPGSFVDAVISDPAVLWQSFTPVVTAPAGSTAPRFTVNSGRFRLVNDLVLCNIDLANVTGGIAGSGAGQLSVALPVQLSAATTAITLGPIGHPQNNATYWFLSGVLTPRAVSLPLTKWTGSGSSFALSVLSGADLAHANIREINLSFFYEVSQLPP
jgi:hypothetical protein